MIFVDRSSSPRTLCNAIQDLAASKVPRPWNRFEPDSTEWWLVPSSDWPAYKYGKLFFRWGNENRASVLAGLYIEKGLAQTVREAYSSPKGSRFIMDDTWSWYLLLDELRNDRIPIMIEDRSHELDAPLEIIIEAGYVQEPTEFDPYAPGFERDLCTFRCMPNTEGLTLDRFDAKQDLLTAMTGVSTWQALLTGLEQLGSNDWLWIDFFVGLEVQEPTKEIGQKASWSAEELWANWLLHLDPWLIAAG